MIKKISRSEHRRIIHLRVRKRVRGTSDRPRLSVFKSLKHIYAQIIDDDTGKTVAAASTLDKSLRGRLAKHDNIEAAKAVGELIAERAQSKGIKRVVFDRSGYIYHGRVKALADAARQAGLEF